MSFKKNTAITGLTFGLVSATDGSDVTTGSVTGYYTLDGGSQATISGTPVHEGNGQWSVNLTSGEMNGNIVGLSFSHASAISVHFTIKTDTKIVSELKDETMRGTDGANTLAPDNSSISDILIDTNELQSNQGNWATATGFSTFDPASDTVVNVTNVANNADMRGTDGANTLAPDNSSISDILIDTNELQSNQGNWVTGDSAATIATATRVEMDANSTKLQAIVDDTNTTIPSLIASLEDLSAAEVKAQLVAALTTDALAEPATLPASNASLAEKLAYLFAVAGNKQTQTSATQTIRNRLDSADISSATTSDDGTTLTRGAHG